jgi:hypothetical protein
LAKLTGLTETLLPDTLPATQGVPKSLRHGERRPAQGLGGSRPKTTAGCRQQADSQSRAHRHDQPPRPRCVSPHFALLQSSLKRLCSLTRGKLESTHQYWRKVLAA